MSEESIKFLITSDLRLALKLIFIHCPKIPAQLNLIFTHRNTINFLLPMNKIHYKEIYIQKVTLGDCLFGPVTLNKNGDPDKYGYRYGGYGTGSDVHSQYSLLIGENVIIFCVGNSSARLFIIEETLSWLLVKDQQQMN